MIKPMTPQSPAPLTEQELAEYARALARVYPDSEGYESTFGWQRRLLATITERDTLLAENRKLATSRDHWKLACAEADGRAERAETENRQLAAQVAACKAATDEIGKLLGVTLDKDFGFWSSSVNEKYWIAVCGAYNAACKVDADHLPAAAAALLANQRTLAEANKFLCNVLRDAGRQFRSYELSHMKKQTVDGDIKAETNRSFARACEAAVDSYEIDKARSVGP